MIEFERLRRMMDEFMECGMDFDSFEREFDRRFAEFEQEFYREFFHTLKKTVELCNNMECCSVPEPLHLSLITTIEQTPQKPTRRKTRKSPKKY